MDLKEKINILSKPIWTTIDIMHFFEVGHPKAVKMLEATILRGNALVPTTKNKVYSERVVELFTGHSREKEMGILVAGVNNEEK